MSFLEKALLLASHGYHVFPIQPNGKKPAIKDFPNKATRDPEIIKDWWIDPIFEIEKDYNIGISTSKYGENESLVVIDVDNKGDKKGDEELEKLDMLGNDIPQTFLQLTPTGGKHLVYKHVEALKQGVNVLGMGLDIRSKGGYIVAIGSVIDGKPYHGPITNPSPAPEWLVETLGKAPEKSEEVVDVSNINKEAAVERAKYYLENEAPESIKGQGGDQTAYKVAARVKDYGVDQDTCLELMLDHWFNGSGWTPEKLKLKIEHAYKYGNEAVGAAAPEAQFERITYEPSEESLSYLQKMNLEYALVYMGGNHFILHETVDEKGRPFRAFLSEQTFKRRFSPYSVQKKTTYAQEWLDWKNRREYKGVCFAPEREARNGYYNLWRGFTVEPLAYDAATPEQRKGFDAFISHTRENICQGDERLFTWLIGYFAHLVQKPFERPLTSLVFRGSKGTGKNAFIDRIGQILGSGHYLVAHDGRYLTSNFNGHFDSCLCLVLDEAFWSGDKAAEGKLKGITTSPEIMIERKGKEPYQVDNLVRVIIIGNEDWLVPASTDERRYAVCDVGNGKKQNRKFFHDMRVAMDEKGGNRILLDYLQKFDISKVDVNDAPKTQALLEQKTNSLEPFENFWFNCLKEGKLLNSEFGDNWPDTADTHSFRSAFLRTIRDMNIRSRLPDDVALGMRLKKMCPGMVKTKRREGDRTVNVYKFPSLMEARLDWDAFIGQESKWE